MDTSKCAYGYTGKIATVDLTTGETGTIETAKYAPDFIGARGMAEKVFWDLGDFDADCFDPASTLVLMTSPLTGTLASGSQMALFGRSTTLPNPQLRASMCGSGFGGELKRAGFDGLVLTGASDTPVYLYIHDDAIDIRAADEGTLWGLDTLDSRAELFRRHGRRSCALVIGPAGENLCRDGIIATDDCHSFANGGFGAVWGSKKLKAIVASGTKDISVADPAALIADVRHAQDLAVRPPYEKTLKNASRQMNAWAYRHFNAPKQDFLLRQEKGEIELGWSACLNCHLACAMTHRYPNGEGAGVTHCEDMDIYSMATAEYYGEPACNEHAFQCSQLVQRLGLNEWGYTDHSPLTAFMQAGYLTQEYTGLDPKEFGSVEYFDELMHKVVSHEPGFGADLAQGWYRVAQTVGDEALELMKVLHVKDNGTPDFQGMPGRVFKGSLMGQTTNSLGIKLSTAITNNLYYPMQLDPDLIEDEDVRQEIIGNVSEKFLGDREIGLRPDDPAYAPEGGRWCLEQNIILDTLSMCSFAFPIIVSNYTDDHTGELFAAAYYHDVTGNDITEKELREVVADRIIALERLISYRGGHEVNELRAMNFAENGGFWPEAEVRSCQLGMYRLLGWDEQAGLPTKTKLRELGLEQEMDEALAAGVPLAD